MRERIEDEDEFELAYEEAQRSLKDSTGHVPDQFKQGLSMNFRSKYIVAYVDRSQGDVASIENLLTQAMAENDVCDAKMAEKKLTFDMVGKIV